MKPLCLPYGHADKLGPLRIQWSCGLVFFLECLFFLGLIGSLVVAIWAFVGDVHVFFDKD